MGNLVTIVICLVILAGLFILLFHLVRGLFYFIADHAHAARIMIKQPGAQEAYDILQADAVDGHVSEASLTQAIGIMLHNGASEKDVFSFLSHCSLLIEMDATKTRRKIERINDQLRDLSYDDWFEQQQLEAKKDAAYRHLNLK